MESKNINLILGSTGVGKSRLANILEFPGEPKFLESESVNSVTEKIQS